MKTDTQSLGEERARLQRLRLRRSRSLRFVALDFNAATNFSLVLTLADQQSYFLHSPRYIDMFWARWDMEPLGSAQRLSIDALDSEEWNCRICGTNLFCFPLVSDVAKGNLIMRGTTLDDHSSKLERTVWRFSRLINPGSAFKFPLSANEDPYLMRDAQSRKEEL